MNDFLFLAFMGALVTFWTSRVRAQLRQRNAGLVSGPSSEGTPGQSNAVSTSMSLITTIVMAIGTVVVLAAIHWNLLPPWLPISAIVISIVAGTVGLINALVGRRDQRSN